MSEQNTHQQTELIVAQFTPESRKKFDDDVTYHIGVNGFISPGLKLKVAKRVLYEQQNPEMFAAIFS